MPSQAAKLHPTAGGPFPADLGAYLLTRLTALETHSARLQQKAEAAGENKTALLALRLNFRILLAMAKIARQFPQAAQNWQAPVPPNHLPASTSPPSAPAPTSNPVHPKLEPRPDTRLRPVNADW